jgi:peptidoglycan/xylan/chitin deacetylase (PgdA/CDA1 family)
LHIIGERYKIDGAFKVEKGSNWNITAWKRGLLVGILGLAMVGMAASIRGRQAEDDNSIDVLSDVSEKKEIQKQEPKKIALTFDDGPHKIYTEKLLDGLAERNVKATFFFAWNQYRGEGRHCKTDRGGRASDWKSHVLPCGYYETEAGGGM